MKRLGSMREMSSRMMIAGVLTIALGVVALAGTAAGARLPDRPPIPGRYIVVFKDSVDHPADVARSQTARHNGELRRVYRFVLRGYSAHLPEQAVAALARDPRVAYIEPDIPIRAAGQTVPTGIRRTFASSNPYLGINGIEDLQANVDVAVIDQGVEYHADLNVFRRTNCFYARRATECIEGSVAPGPHGTHVAGIIGAKDNSSGVTGIAPGARLWSVQVLDPYTNEGWLEAYIAAIEWVTLHAAEIEVANSSVSYVPTYAPTYDPILTRAMENSIDAGIVHVAAAGNQRTLVSRPPANIPDVITVSAIADYDGRPGEYVVFPAVFECASRGFDDRTYDRSNYGFRVDITAPGVCIYSTLPNGQYGYESGTSMAAPYVAGAAAILATHFNTNSRNDVLEIRETLVREGNLGWTDDSGDGIQEPLLDVGNAWYFWLGSSSQTEPPSEYTPRPTGTTGTVSNATTSAATLSGTVNPHGASTQYYFEYGLTRDYGTRMPSRSFPSGIYSAQAVSQAISGLQPNTTYHLRLVASSAGGTIGGGDQEFATLNWTIQTTPNAAGASHSSFYAVGCEPSSTNLCTAVGKSSSSGVETLMAQRWDGTSWSLQSPALKSGATHTRLYGVDCPSTIRCIAVGNSQVSGSGAAILAELWNENRWSIQSTPVPANATSSELKGVGCNSTADCVAVGSAVVGNVRTAIAERWRSPTWTLQTVPIPADAASSQLDGVDCLWSNFCVAVGRYTTSGGSTRRLAMFWNGTNWSLQTLAEPAGATSNSLNGVSCTASPNACTVVGSWTNANDRNRASTLAYRFNGSSWTLQSTPNSSEGVTNVFADVSCATATACTATGYWVSGSGSNRTLAAHWNGSSWSLEGTPDPSGAVFSTLNGASCRLTRCIAVGFSWNSAGATSTLGLIR